MDNAVSTTSLFGDLLSQFVGRQCATLDSPDVRPQLVDFPQGMAGLQACDDVCKIRSGVDAEILAAADQRVNAGEATSGVGRTAKKVIFATDDRFANLAFDAPCVQLESTLAKAPHHKFFLLAGVSQRFAKVATGPFRAFLALDPGEQRFGGGPRFALPQYQSLIKRCLIVTCFPLDCVNIANMRERNCGMPLARLERDVEWSAQMHPAAQATVARHKRRFFAVGIRAQGAVAGIIIALNVPIDGVYPRCYFVGPPTLGELQGHQPSVADKAPQMTSPPLGFCIGIKPIQAGVVDPHGSFAENARQHDLRYGLHETASGVPVAVKGIQRHVKAETRQLLALTINRKCIIAFCLEQVREQRCSGTSVDLRPRSYDIICITGARATCFAGPRRSDDVLPAIEAGYFFATLHCYFNTCRDVFHALVINMANKLHTFATMNAVALRFGHGMRCYISFERRIEACPPRVSTVLGFFRLCAIFAIAFCIGINAFLFLFTCRHHRVSTNGDHFGTLRAFSAI